ncbi:hypothetical protein JG688_00014457 [Phytophthora aleatoria]|uniref:Uncharacterized protein n=1 Tax=Phytophthora aleatoria TaxID=2496075 RepID=A0A8J5IH93_9STRA|nr:hypothetical protein JG688_00014457 [Phytophthora aleatoria]
MITTAVHVSKSQTQDNFAAMPLPFTVTCKEVVALVQSTVHYSEYANGMATSISAFDEHQYTHRHNDTASFFNLPLACKPLSYTPPRHRALSGLRKPGSPRSTSSSGSSVCVQHSICLPVYLRIQAQTKTEKR